VYTKTKTILRRDKRISRLLFLPASQPAGAASSAAPLARKGFLAAKGESRITWQRFADLQATTEGLA